MQLIIHLEDPDHVEEDPRHMLLIVKNCSEREAELTSNAICRDKPQLGYYSFNKTIVAPDDFPIETSTQPMYFDSAGKFAIYYLTHGGGGIL